MATESDRPTEDDGDEQDAPEAEDKGEQPESSGKRPKKKVKKADKKADKPDDKPDKPKKKVKKTKKKVAKKTKKKARGKTDDKPGSDEGDAKKSKIPPLGKLIWPALILAGIIEIWLFGSRAHIELCVGREGEHDFALLGTPRTDDNTRRFPTCEKRLNIGINRDFKEREEDAMIHACKRATILRGKRVALECAIAIKGWEHRTTASYCPPWHDHYYKRLFWFFFSND